MFEDYTVNRHYVTEQVEESNNLSLALLAKRHNQQWLFAKRNTSRDAAVEKRYVSSFHKIIRNSKLFCLLFDGEFL